jgi:hypothetical protein
VNGTEGFRYRRSDIAHPLPQSLVGRPLPAVV